MGTASSRPVQAREGAAAGAFDADDLLRALQESGGYQVYDVFERPSDGGRLPAPVRLWDEAVEAAREDAAAATGADEDAQQWVVLTSPSPGKAPGAPAKGARSGKGRPPPPAPAGKGKGPPLPGKGGKGPPMLPKGKAGAGPPPAAKKAAPPPFGKRLHWKLLPATALGDTIFEELRPWGEVQQPLDTVQLERLLAPPAPPARPQRGATASGCAEAMTGKASARGPAGACSTSGKVCLLDDRRAQNLAIVLRQVSMKTEELAEVLRWMRLSHPVTADELEHVCDNLLPPLLESPELGEYTGPTEDLRSVERQLLPLVRLPRLKARLQTLRFSKSIPLQHRSLQSRIHSLQAACKQVRSSPALRRVMGTVLRVGNYLNHGVDAPDAGGGVEVRGFAVESLLKLRDFRAAQSGEVHALHCVVLHLLPVEPALPTQLRAELRNVLELPGGQVGAGPAEGWISDLRDAVGSFQSETDLVQGEIERFADCYRLEGDAHEGPGPLAVLQRLVEDAGELACGLEADFDAARMQAWKLLEYFGERRGSADGQPPGGWGDETYQTVEAFFSTIREFVLSLEDCWKDVRDQPRKFRLEAGGASPSRRAAPAASPPPQRREAPPERKTALATPRKLPPQAPLSAPPPHLAGFGAVAAAAAAAAAAGRAAKQLTAIEASEGRAEAPVPRRRRPRAEGPPVTALCADLD